MAVPSNTVTTNVPPAAIAPAPGMSITKSQRDVTTSPNGMFTTGTVNATVGDTIQYQIVVANTGNVALKLAFGDSLCDANTLTGPNGGLDATGSLAAGASTTYMCTHVVTAGNIPSATNTATVSATTPTGTPVGPVLEQRRGQRDAGAQPEPPGRQDPGAVGLRQRLQHGAGSAKVGSTVLYHLTVTNTGNVPLALHLSDPPHCDAGTLQPPTSGLDASGDVPAGGNVVYSCSHTIKSGDGTAFTNTVSVTGTAPSGAATPPATSSVVANIPKVAAKACVAGSAKLTKTTTGNDVVATVTGTKITRVSFFLDGKGLKTLLKPNVSSNGWRVAVTPKSYSFGTHTIKAAVTVSCGGPLSAKTAFQHPAPTHSVTPKFTG